MTDDVPPPKTQWPAIACLSVLSFLLVGLEFMPATLLTPIARDLGVTDGQVGFAIGISALFAVLTSLFGAALLARWDRRAIIAGYTAILTVSSVLIALGPDFATFLVGRVLVGIAVGGFWSLAVALMARLAQPADVPRAIAALQIGTAIAFVLAPSLGSYLGQWIGWRGTFWVTVPMGCVALVWQMAVMPSLPPGTAGSIRGAATLLRRPVVCLGLLAGGMAFMGQFALSIYFRPVLETVTGVSPETLSLALLMLGLGGLAGTLLVGPAMRLGLTPMLVGLPVALAALALVMIAAAPVLTMVVPLLVVWGVMTTPIPAIWGTWASRTVPDDLETAGGLQAALIQLCIAAGAVLGGVAYDGFGWQAACLLSAALSVVAAALALATVRRA